MPFSAGGGADPIPFRMFLARRELEALKGKNRSDECQGH